MKHAWTYLLTFLLLAGGAVQARTVAERLGEGRKALDASLAAIAGGHQSSLRTWEAGYLAELESLQAGAQRAGELDKVLVLREEAARFQGSRALPAEGVAVTLPELKSLQERQGQSLRQLSLDRDRQILALRDKYVTSLEDLKRRLTQAGEIDGAVEVDADIKSLRRRPEVAAAEFGLAAAGEAAPASVSPASPAAVAAMAPGGVVKMVKASPQVVFEAGRRQPPESAFKTVAMRSTSMGGALQVRLHCGVAIHRKVEQSRSGSSSSRSAMYYSRSSSATANQEQVVALVLRARRTDEMIASPRVTVHYFATREGGSAAPEAIQTFYAVFSHLDAAGGVLVFPGVSTSSQSTASVFGGGYGSISRTPTMRSGYDFAGILVTVADAEGLILHQSLSNTALDAFAEKALEENKRVATVAELESRAQAYEEARQAYERASRAAAGNQDPTLRRQRDDLRRAMNTAREAHEQARRAVGP